MERRRAAGANSTKYSVIGCRISRATRRPKVTAIQAIIPLLFLLFVGYSLSGYGMYVYRRAKGKPVSVIATSTDEPDEKGLHQ